ncbi:MAG TPA: phosphatidate cytidylyltransferase [Candidatus Sphingobacterium stercoripullorum]|uniref:Phosphatidate cytidylyltransferase n=1 Tax=Candidatus Sphingobacterium stercoripullorum TaxID=2838759 RepID=A0A9D1W7M4_9SPHI|nr:phosphatidate cytidylyltransferase [Candidatus Sphingobacterium stercoripullorum]HLR51202.1 phosphatidate cytidylyltransferase [Candidatus Sphingobacterium stercoripullorum]
MKTRAITGFFFVLVLLATILWNGWMFLAIFSAISLLALKEFFELSDTMEINAYKPAGYLIGFSFIIINLLISGLGYSAATIALSIPFILFTFIYTLFDRSTRALVRLNITVFAPIYSVLPFLLFINLGFQSESYSYSIPLGFIILLWASDTGAYLFGKSFGKKKLFERLSPNKTWEGFFGGVITSVIAAAIYHHFTQQVDLIFWLLSAVIISSTGTLGDLFESLLKRKAGVKDSGHLLPGHGGVLDRFDGLLFSAPLINLVLIFWI